MSKTPILSLKALGAVDGIVKTGIRISKMQEALKRAKTSKLNPLQRLAQNINDYGLTQQRYDAAKDLYDSELKGRTLASVKMQFEKQLSNAIAATVNDAEVKIVKAYYAMMSAKKYDVLKFYQDMFIAQEKANKAVKELVETK
jgi:hypothetical protein